MSGEHSTQFMPTVVHIGPISSPGGIQSVIKTLTDHPMEGWDVQQIESHSTGSLYSKLKVYASAKNELRELLESKNDVVVHPLQTIPSIENSVWQNWPMRSVGK